ncbi:MAG: hypothetical protein ABFR50_12245, partial [Candidatus Fermentibacteria bacterium]
AVFQLGKFCGLGNMLELVQTGRVYSGAEACELGIVHASAEAADIEIGVSEVLARYESRDMNVHVLMRRLSKESYSISYDDFIGSYLAAQHRILSMPDGAGDKRAEDE